MSKDYNNPSLFLNDEFEDIKLTPDKVVCLGMEFESEDARRAYFREELRKKLPELKQIEGFPIGEDDDIINLSDPPYYTACPNPWLNDFIQEWELDKRQLEREGKRQNNFEVKMPYASDISEGKNNPIYNAHSYHTKVPHPAIMRYIMYYTQPGDIIWDGFSGTGMTGVASAMCVDSQNAYANKIEVEFKEKKIPILWGERKAILTDLSPVASLISGVYNFSQTSNDIFDRIEEIILKSQEKFDWMYRTEHENKQVGYINYTVWSDVFICPICSHEYTFYNVAVNESTNEIATEYLCPHCSAQITKTNSLKAMESFYDSVLNEVHQMQKKVPVLINYSVGKKTYNKKLGEFDLEIIKKAKLLSESFTYTKDRMINGSEARRNDRQGITHVHHFYFPRTLLIFEDLFKKCFCKEMFFLLNSQLINVSKLNRYRPGKSFPYNPLSGTLYIGSQISEANVFIALLNKLKKMRVALSGYKAKNVTGVSSATDISIKDSSIDYIFTDPPFGANFSYSELNFIQESWLKVKTENTKEAIENESHNKSKSDYKNLMTLCFKEYYRVLKPNGWITIEFSNTSAAIWNAISQALQNSGFIIVNVSALDKQQGSFKAITTTTAVKQDLVITCYKPRNLFAEKIKDSVDKSLNVMDFIEELLVHLPVHLEKDHSTTAVIERSPKILYDRLLSYYVQHGYDIPMDAQEFQKGLRERFIERDGMFFTASQALEYEEKKKGTNGIIPMALFISSEAEGIEWLKRELETPQTYQELHPEWMKAMSTTKKGDVLPELMTILEENFIKDEDGKWRKPDPEKAADLEIIRNRKMMKEFNMYLEQAQKPKAKRMKDTRLEVLRYGFKECYKQKDYKSIILVGDHIQESLLQEDEVLLQYYDIASTRV